MADASPVVAPGSTPQPFNINHYVRIRLTDAGRAHLRKIDGDWRLKYSNAEDADGWSRWQLWDFMHTFGAAMYMGGQVPFETTIQIEQVAPGIGETPHPPTSRLMEMASHQASENHYTSRRWFGVADNPKHPVDRFDLCPHPDCVLVRSGVVPPHASQLDDTDQHGHIGAPGAPPTWMRGPLTAEAQARFAALHASQPETIQRDLKGVMPSALHKCCTIPSAGIHPDVAGAAVDTGAQHPAKNTAAPHAAPHADPEQEIRALQDSVHRRAKAYNELAEKHDEQTAALTQLSEGLHALIATGHKAAEDLHRDADVWRVKHNDLQRATYSDGKAYGVRYLLTDLAALLAASEGKP